MRKGRDGEKKKREKRKKKKTGKKKKIRMKIVATTSLPAVDRPNADRWNAARSRQYQPSGEGGTRSPPATPQSLQIPKWPTGGPKMADGVWKGAYP